MLTAQDLNIIDCVASNASQSDNNGSCFFM